jgi:glucose-6-phosphate-specific signal transduction histidine kinase
MTAKKRVLVWELAGIVFIVVLGSVLHFAFEWSGRAIPIAPVAAVNESVWEHLKLGFWPALVYAALEYSRFGKSANNFSFAKTLGIYLIPITIVVLFYAYTAILGHDLLEADIATFVVAVIVGQLVSYRLLIASPLPERLNRFAPIALAVLGILFVLFTFYPPHLPPFRDSVTGAYGIGG